MFEDVPVDTRHHAFTTKPKFPKEWRLTDERRKELEDTRRQSFLLDEGKREKSTLVDGAKIIDKALEELSMKETVAELANLRKPRGNRLPGRR
jgi:small subunit ribosomal protein S35